MRNDSPEARNLKQLLESLDAKHHPDDPPASDPVTQLVIGFLQWGATREEAESAFAHAMQELVDINELRVSHDEELVELFGQNYPNVWERTARMREALNAIYVREHAVAMHSIAEKSKKEQRAYLDSLPGMTPYVAAQVTLLSFGGHALPIDQKLVDLLVQQEILQEGTTPAHAESELLRQVRAAEALHTHMLLQAWADEAAGGKKRGGSKSRSGGSRQKAANQGGGSGRRSSSGSSGNAGQKATARSSKR